MARACHVCDAMMEGQGDDLLGCSMGFPAASKHCKAGARFVRLVAGAACSDCGGLHKMDTYK